MIKHFIAIITSVVLISFSGFSQDNSSITGVFSVDTTHLAKENCELADLIKKDPAAFPDFSFFDTICSSVELNLLTFKSNDSKISELINGTITKEICNKFGMSEEPYTSLSDLLNSVDDEEAGFNISIGMETITNEKNVLTVQVWQDYFGHGAAHPLFFSNFYTFDGKTGKLIQLEDIVPSYQLHSLTNIVRKQFIKENGSEGWYFTSGNGDFFLPANFSFDKNGITFYYNQYEIGPYVMGSPAVSIKYDAIKYLLQPDSILERYRK